MQEILVLLAVVFSLYMVGRLFYRTWFVSNDKCSGCAIKKMHEQATAATREATHLKK